MITCFKARKILEEQQSAPGKSYTSITKGAGVRCIDAQTQTDETYNFQLTSTASGDGPTRNHILLYSEPINKLPTIDFYSQ